MKKIIAYLLAMVMILTTMSTCVISVSADTAGSTTTEDITEEIFTETFENYTKGENWLDHTESSYVTGVVPAGKENDWYISSSRLGATDAEIMVVDATTEGIEADGVDRGQVLKINGGNTGKTILSVRRTFENEPELGKNSSGKITYADFTEKSKGKKLVYEVEYFTPADFYSGEAHFMTFSTSKDPGQYSYGAGTIYAALSGNYNHIFAKTGDDKTTYGTRLYQNFDDRGKWHTLKIVADFSEQSRADYWNTSRVYYDGKLLTATYKAKNSDTTNIITPDAPYEVGDRLYDYASTTPPTATTPYPARFSSVYGMLFSAVNSTSKTEYNGKAVYYINNFKAYWVDELAVVSKENTEDFESGDIKLNFNSKINDSITKYAPAHSTAVTQSRYKESDKVTKSLSDLVTIVDNNNNLVEGAILSVALENDNKTLKVTPDVSKLAGGATYKIALHPLFSDEYGQAFTGNTTSYPKTKYIEFTTKSTDFVASVDKSSISDAMGSVNAKATVSFSNIVTAADIENAFVVTNAKTNEAVTEGWSYTLSDDGKNVEIDFSELNAGSYKLTMNQITVSGKPLVNASDIVILVSLAEKLATDPLFNETFEDYEKGVNWLENLSGDFVTSTNTKVKEKDWYVSSSYKGATDAQIMVVDAGEKDLEADGVERGNILMINGGHTGTTMLSLQKTVNNIKNAGTVSSDNRITYANLIKGAKGRKLVYEVDFYRPTDFYTGEAHFMANSGKLGPAQYSANNGYYTSFSGTYADYIVTMGNSNYTYYVRTQRNYDNRGAWHNMKMVVDYSAESSATNWNTARVYIDDVLVTGKYTVKTTTDTYVVPETAPYEIGDTIYDFANTALPTASTPYPTRASLYGWVFSAKNSTSKTSYDGKAVYYIDNFKAYWVDALEVGELVNGENYVSGDIEIPFNSEIKENVTKFDVTGLSSTRSLVSEKNTTTKNYKDLIYVVDENGAVVEGALSNIRLSDNKRSLIVTPDMNILWGGRTYKIAIDPLFTDVFGQAFTSGVTSQPKTTYVEFTTAKNDSLSISSASNATIEGSNVSTTIELSNVAGATKSAFLAVAVYNKNYEMIGIATTDVTVAAKGTYSAPVTVNITGYTADDVAFVKAHLWSSFADMIAYQPAENIGL